MTSARDTEKRPGIYQAAERRIRHLREGAIGTLTLVAVLLLVFLVELLLAAGLGFDSPEAMFETLSRTSKRALAVSLGPFLHQGYRHIVDNILILLLVGAYVEHGYDRPTFYRFVLVAGYLAAWFPLVLGFTGAVGASGITFGLMGWAISHALFQVFRGVSEVVAEGNLWGMFRFLHLLPLVLCFAKVRAAIVATLSFATGGAGELTHLAGAILGTGWGIRRIATSLSNEE